MFWTFEEWKKYQESQGRSELESKLRSELSIHGRQAILGLLQEIMERMAFDEDMLVIHHGKSRTYAEACQEIIQMLGSMKITDERNNYDA